MHNLSVFTVEGISEPDLACMQHTRMNQLEFAVIGQLVLEVKSRDGRIAQNKTLTSWRSIRFELKS